jgi:hypothetical protein
VVHVITARSAAAARLSLAQAAGAPMVGLASSDDVRSILEAADVATVRYPDTGALAGRALDLTRRPGPS